MAKHYKFPPLESAILSSACLGYVAVIFAFVVNWLSFRQIVTESIEHITLGSLFFAIFCLSLANFLSFTLYSLLGDDDD